jgi:hypothetical protein
MVRSRDQSVISRRRLVLSMLSGAFLICAATLWLVLSQLSNPQFQVVRSTATPTSTRGSEAGKDTSLLRIDLTVHNLGSTAGLAICEFSVRGGVIAVTGSVKTREVMPPGDSLMISTLVPIHSDPHSFADLVVTSSCSPDTTAEANSTSSTVVAVSTELRVHSGSSSALPAQSQVPPGFKVESELPAPRADGAADRPGTPRQLVLPCL